jgi:tetratricopeptide (TPR) repeat protein
MRRILFAHAICLLLVSQGAFAAVPDDKEVKDAFNRGRQLYHSGQYEEALKVFKEIAPYSKDEVTVLGLISSVEEKLKLSGRAETAADTASADAVKKPEAPAELTAFLKTANQRFQSRIDAAGGVQSDAASRVATSRGFIDQKLSEGNLLALAGKYPEAAAVWRELIPYFSDGEALKSELDLLERNAAAVKQSHVAVEEALARRDEKPALPADARKFVSDRNRDLMQASLDAEKKQVELAAESSARREASRSALLAARELYETDRIADAVAAWKQVAPEFSDGPALLADLAELEKSFGRSLAAWDAMKKADEEAKRRLDPSEELKLVIGQARQKLDAETAAAQIETVTTKKGAGIKPTAEEARMPLDEVDKMMLDFNVTTMAELEKRYQSRGVIPAVPGTPEEETMRPKKKFLGIL